MMNIPVKSEIRQLPKQVADKIAAGEVVDRPVSIVKELVENSIDAGATSITVEIKNGGKTYLRVTDNGCGIPQNQAEMAFQRHATSKIRQASDLEKIETLGFRGEALASIAAVSRAELITKTAEEKSGYRVRIEGGEFVEKTETGCPDGTTLVVSDLFYNTPARMKFLKPDNAESTLIIDCVSKIALAYPAIKIRLINNGNILFSTPGKGDIYTNILTIYSREIGEKLIRIDRESDGMRLIAFVSPPDYSKTNRKNQIFFVNGRSVTSKVLELAVSDAYKEKLFDGRHPIAFLFLAVSPHRLDVNIHPNKKEVRFDDEKGVRTFVTQAIWEGLGSKEAIPEIRQENLFKRDEWVEKKTDQGSNIDIKSFLSTRGRTPIATEPLPAGSEPPAHQSENEFPNQDLHSGKTDMAAVAEERVSYPSNGYPGPLPMPAAPPVKPFDFDGLRATGAIFDTYITAVDDEAFYLIDQHAAHERIFYEQLMSAYNRQERASQLLLASFVVEIPFAVKNHAADFLTYLERIGYHLEEFGAKAYIVKEIPAMMELSEAEDFLEYFLDNINADFRLTDPVKVDKIIMKACKSAVKANDHLQPQEIDALLRDLAKTRNPFSCPHGRPTFIKLTKHEIEKLFKRVL